MTKLRQDFIDHFELRGYAESTTKNYVGAVSLLARHYNKSPLLLTPPEIKDYLLSLRSIRELAVRTYNIHFYGIKCFYEHFCPGQNMMSDLPAMINCHCITLAGIVTAHGVKRLHAGSGCRRGKVSCFPYRIFMRCLLSLQNLTNLY